jgi:hypothetical protein
VTLQTLVNVRQQLSKILELCGFKKSSLLISTQRLVQMRALLEGGGAICIVRYGGDSITAAPALAAIGASLFGGGRLDGDLWFHFVNQHLSTPEPPLTEDCARLPVPCVAPAP